MSGFAGRKCTPAFLWVAPKEKPPCTVEEKGAKAQNGAMRLICLKYGGPSKRPGWSRQNKALGAVLAISISLACGLRQKLAHSDARPLPTKTAPLGFRGGLETFGFQPRESELLGRAKTGRTSG